MGGHGFVQWVTCRIEKWACSCSRRHERYVQNRDFVVKFSRFCCPPTFLFTLFNTHLVLFFPFRPRRANVQINCTFFFCSQVKPRLCPLRNFWSMTKPFDESTGVSFVRAKSNVLFYIQNKSRSNELEAHPYPRVYFISAQSLQSLDGLPNYRPHESRRTCRLSRICSCFYLQDPERLSVQS